MTLVALYHLRWAQRLPGLAMLKLAGTNEKLANCSVVLAARDEEARIGNTVRRLLAQRGVELEIIVVVDRSTDRTGEILRRLAEADARVHYLRVDTLPEG